MTEAISWKQRDCFPDFIGARNDNSESGFFVQPLNTTSFLTRSPDSRDNQLFMSSSKLSNEN